MTDEIEKGADGKDKKEAPMSFIEQIVSNDIIGPWIESKAIPQYYVFNKTGQLISSQFVTNMPEAPWIYTNWIKDRHCSWFKMIDALHNFIPKQCLNCWKVVVMPKTLKALFQLLKIQQEMAKVNPYCHCKCGIEVRKDVERNYGGYFYTNSFQEGLTRLAEVRAKVYPILGADTTVILKRACTEYERKHGPSDKWDDLRTEQHEIVEEFLYKVFAPGYDDLSNSNLMQRHTLHQWIEYAASIGDPTIPELNNGKRIFPGYVTYEPIKREASNCEKKE